MGRRTALFGSILTLLLTRCEWGERGGGVELPAASPSMAVETAPALPSPPAAVAPPQPAPAAAAVLPSVNLTRLQERQIAAWYAALGQPQLGESYGSLVSRAALQQLGKPYDFSRQVGAEERLQCHLDRFECLTLVESALALAQCTWLRQRRAACFVRQLLGWRYRHGQLAGYTSRLHYFEDWLQDNAQRGQLKVITADLGGNFIAAPFFYISQNRQRYPNLADGPTRQAFEAVEKRLSRTPVAVLSRQQLAEVQHVLQDGDIVALGAAHAGLLTRHTGLIQLDAQRVPHFLHASSLQRQVVLSQEDVANFARRRGDRRSVLVARPLAPVP